MIKLLMGWDIKRDKDAEFFEFIIREFTPTMANLGLLPSEAWFTVYGEGPQMLAAGIANNLETMQEILESEGWLALKAQLLDYVTNYRERIVRPLNTLQIL